MTRPLLLVDGTVVTLTESPGNFKIRFTHQGKPYDWPGWQTWTDAQEALWFIQGMWDRAQYPAAKWAPAWYGVDPNAEIVPILSLTQPAKKAPVPEAQQVRAREGQPWKRQHRPISD